MQSAQFLVHEGSVEKSRALIKAAGSWAAQLHNEIYVYNQGYWQKDGALWQEVQKADWKDIIMSQEFKTILRKDVMGFFDSEALYKELALPWKVHSSSTQSNQSLLIDFIAWYYHVWSSRQVSKQRYVS